MKKTKLLLALLICTMMLSACSSQKSAEQSSDTQSISETQSSAESRNDPSQIDLNAGKLKGADACIYGEDYYIHMGSTVIGPRDEKNTEIPNPLNLDEKKLSEILENNTGKYSDQERYEYLHYLYYKEIGVAKPNMRKITADELVSILKSAELNDELMKIVVSDDQRTLISMMCDERLTDYDRSQKIYDEILKIQYFDDAYTMQGYKFFYWPDADYLSVRRKELVFSWKYMTLEQNIYDESGNIVSKELLYSYPYELEKAAIEKYGCSEERASRRITDPYTIKYYTDPTPPETTEKLTGEEVLIPEDKRNGTKSGHDEYERLAKNAEELGYGYAGFKYQQNVALGNAYPNMRKITVNEILDIANNSDIDTSVYSDCNDPELCKRWTLSIIPEIQKIQYFPDSENTQFCDYCYWPDADTVEERRTEIRIFGDSGTIHVFTYDDNGKRINNEQIFSLDEKVMSMLET